MESKTLKGTTHYIFDTMAEFRDHFGPSASAVKLNWRQADEGDWVLSDDGRIIQLLKVVKALKHHQDKPGKVRNPNGYVRTIVGTFIANNRTFMDTDFSKHTSRYSFSGRPHHASMVKVRLFAKLLWLTGDPWFAFTKAYPRSHSVIHIGIRIDRLLRDDRVWDMIKKEMENAAEKAGAGDVWVFQALKEMAEDKEQTGKIRLEAIREVLITQGKRPSGQEPGQPSPRGMFGMFSQMTEYQPGGLLTPTQISRIEGEIEHRGAVKSIPQESNQTGKQTGKQANQHGGRDEMDTNEDHASVLPDEEGRESDSGGEEDPEER